MKRKAIAYRFRMLPTALIIFILFLLGCLVSVLHDPRRCGDHFCHDQTSHVYRLKLLDVPAKKEKSWKVFAEVIASGDSIHMQPSSGKVMLYLKHCEAASSLTADDEIMLNGIINEIPPPMNPHVFNYQKYLHLMS